MLTYVIVVAVVVIVLYASFRALAGGQPVDAAAGRELLARLYAVAVACAADIDAALEAAPPAPGDDADPLVQSASIARKTLAGCQQRLAELSTPAGGDDGDQTEAARTLLAAAVDEYGWACRIVEDGSFRDNPGLRTAVSALTVHGGECLASVRSLLGVAE